MFSKNNRQSKGIFNDRVMRRGFLKGGIVVGLTTITSFFNPISSIHAATLPTLNKAKVDVLAGKEANKYLQVVLASHGYSQFKKDLLQTYKKEAVALQEEKVTVFKVDSSTIVVRIPITSKVEGSFYSAIFSGTSLIVDTTLSGLFLSVQDENVRIIARKNENMVLDQTFSPPSNGVVLPSAAVIPNGVNLYCFDRCLANAGIGWASVQAIGAYCGISCAISIGTCLACAIAVAGLSGAIVAYCAGTCWR